MVEMFNRCGGQSFIERLLSEVFKRIDEIPHLSKHFPKEKRERLLSEQVSFFSYLFGGPVDGDGRPFLLKGEAPHFSSEDALRLSEIVENALKKTKVNDVDYENVIKIFKSRIHEMVTPGKRNNPKLFESS